MKRIKGLLQLIRVAGVDFKKHKTLKLSASLAFYTFFTLGPMLLIIIFFSNLFWQREAIDGTIYKHIGGVVGNTAALQIQEIIKNASISGHNFTAVLSFIILLIAATTTFSEMQDSLNLIWNLRVKKGSGFIQLVKSRLMSFVLVLGLGFYYCFPLSSMHCWKVLWISCR